MPAPRKSESSWLASLGLRLSDWFERWFPDAFALSLVVVLIVFAGAVSRGNSMAQTAQWFGAGFWDLTVFTMQMSMIIVSGYALATAPPVYAVIRRMAGIPRSPRGAAAFVALFAMLASLLSWSFSLIFSGLLAREVAQRVRGADYRALGAAGYLSVGCGVWAMGLSSSAPLIMAAPASLPQSIQRISGVIPLSQTIGLWQSMLAAAVLLTVAVAVAFYSAPATEQARGMKEMGVSYEPAAAASAKRERPGDWLEVSPLLTILICSAGIAYLFREVADKGPGVLLDLNHFIFWFLIMAILLHWRPRSFMQAVAAAVPSVAGVLIQYPLYAGVVRMMTESGLARDLTHLFIAVSTQHTFPVLVGLYSGVLGLFVPSAGAKWLIEAPYVLDAAKSLHVHLGWVVVTYNATEALGSLVNPFWMLPLLGIMNLKPRNIVGYTVLQLAVQLPVVLFLVWILNYTFQ